MEKEFKGSRTVLLGALALALAATLGAQSTTSSTTPADSSQTAQPAPGTAPVAGDAAPPPPSATADNKEQGSDAKGKKDKDKKDKGKKDKDKDKDEAEAGTTPVKGDSDAKVDPDKVVAVGGDLRKVKPGSVEDVSAVGNRDIGGRGLGNWYSTDTEIKMGK